MAAAARSIHPLPDHLVNQIAAGEVIERPASVVKELLENSLDAGARRIEVELGEGGLDFISVSDDGHGMAPLDLGAALRRHWTSKLADAAGLAAIATLGFRGEALASIAAVATVEITSRVAGAEHGWRLFALPGVEPGPPQPCQAAPGTRVVVRELFHCVPARRRFLKRPRTEALHVEQVVRRAAFASPTVALRLEQAGSRGLRLPPVDGPGEARWETLFGRGFLRTARRVDYADADVRIHGWVGDPAEPANQAEPQYLALNGRAIRDRQLQHAVRLAIGERLPPGAFPRYALALETAPEAVDVNVHPGKLEVRFVDTRGVHDRLLMAVRDALDGVSAAPGPRPPAATGAATPLLAEAQADYRPRAAPGRASQATAAAVAAGPPVALPGRVLAAVGTRWLLLQAEDGVRALDLVAAWRAVLARRLLRPGTARPLLLPGRLEPALHARIAPRLAALAPWGFAVDDLGAAGAVVRALPAVLPEMDCVRLFAALAGTGEIDAANLATACAGAVAGGEGRVLTEQVAALARGAGAAGLTLEPFLTVVDEAALARAAGRH